MNFISYGKRIKKIIKNNKKSGGIQPGEQEETKH
jgi:hypothetical protein